MKIKNIEIQNYKAFREVERFEIDGKNVLIYGNNGSGKTSLASALQALIQSSLKSQEQIIRVFDRRNDESIVNINTPDKEETYVKLTTDSGDNFRYAINGNTHSDVTLQKANQVSDFINYRLLFRFFNFRDTQNVDIFSIIQDEFFPFWTEPQRSETFQDWFAGLCTKLDGMQKDNVKRNSSRYKSFIEQLGEFNTAIERQVNGLIAPANAYLKVYLALEDITELNLRILKGFSLGSEEKFNLTPPVINIIINYDGKPVNRPHNFLNEARLTSLALALRFAAFETRPKEVSDFKILILDDLLISLDMCLRMKVIDVLLDSYKEYQFLIFTHDKGFYNFLRQKLLLVDDAWKCFEMYENVKNGRFFKPFVRDGMNYLEKAEYYLGLKEYEACAVYLRKKTEETIGLYYDPSIEALTRFKVLGNLSNALGNVSKNYHAQRLEKLSSILDNPDFSTEIILRLTQEPFRGNGTLTGEQVGKANHLRTQIMRFVSEYYKHREKFAKDKEELEDLCLELNRIRSVILNPGAHNDGSNLFETDLRTAISKLKSFEEKVVSLYK